MLQGFVKVAVCISFRERWQLRKVVVRTERHTQVDVASAADVHTAPAGTRTHRGTQREGHNTERDRGTLKKGTTTKSGEPLLPQRYKLKVSRA